MNAELILSRALLAAALGLFGVGALAVANWLARRNTAPRLSALQGLRNQPSGRWLLLYFSSPNCVPCKTVQEPAIAALQTQVKDVEVLRIDAMQRPDLADAWGVVSVPTTFLINAGGQVRHINRGVIRAERLLQQLQQN